MNPTGTQIRRVLRDSGIASFIAFLIGGAATALLLREVGTGVWTHLYWGPGGAWFLLALLAATALNFAGRFVRWHYLLRTCGVLLPTRESARLFYSSFAVLLTPLYLGEIIFKAFFLRRRRGSDLGVAAAVGMTERLHDAVALALIAGATGLFWSDGSSWLLAGVAALLVPAVREGLMAVAAWPVRVAGRILLNQDTSPAQQTLRSLARGRVAGPTFLISVLSWLPVAAALWFVGALVGGRVGLLEGAHLFSTAALLGGISLLPAGVAVAGQSMVQGLTQLGVALPAAVAAVAIVRVITVGMAVLLGLAVLAWTAWQGEFADTGAQAHFDRVSEVYDAEIPLHVRDYLVRKKADLIAAQLNGRPRLGLDLGCGRGYYLEELRSRGYHVVGADLSVEQLRTNRSGGGAVAADAVRLPFSEGTFDFAYSVNLFHHLPSRELQRQGLQEVGRVLKPGGSFFLHEINVMNPLFRFYMGYVFPIVRNIDNGTERWMKPPTLVGQPGLVLREVRYFTFIPDFLPRWAVGWAREWEQRLEKSRWAHLSAHFVARFERC
jgi:SAM-dependent methyltransferase/uncharacterized membrane protein YbhN (UPF0104 family)